MHCVAGFSGIMGMIGKLLLELEYCPQNNRANAKAKPLRTFFTGLMLCISKSFESKILSLSSTCPRSAGQY
jgi:hypothetical protein